jgi:hypothetical protein
MVFSKPSNLQSCRDDDLEPIRYWNLEFLDALRILWPYLATQKDLAHGLLVPVDSSKQVLCHLHYMNLECECVCCAPFSSINAMVCISPAYLRKK